MNRQLRNPLVNNARLMPYQKIWRSNLASFAMVGSLAIGSLLPSTSLAATIQGVKFNDVNANSVRDTNEQGLANETIYIRSMSGGIGTTTVTTDASGNYSFDTQGTSGDFMIWSRIAPEWIQTTPVEGTGMRPYTVTVTPDKPTVVDIGIRDQNVPIQEPPQNTAPQQVSITSSTVNVQEGSEVTFTGNFVDPDIGDVHTIEWQFGDGDVANGIETRHAYSASGNYTVTLTVTDSNEAVGTANVDIVVTTKPNTAPTANAGEDITAHVGEQVQFNGGVVDPDLDDTHTFEWNFGDGSDVATLQNVSHVYLKAGNFMVSLTVKDNHEGTSVDQVEVKVLPSGDWIAFDAVNPILEETPPTLNVPETDSQELIVEFNIPGTIVGELTEDDSIYHQLNLLQESSMSEVGKPELPMFSRLIAVPNGAVAEVQVVDFDVQEIEGYNIYPAQELLPDESLLDDAPPPIFTKDAEVYGRDEFYPADIAILNDPAIIRGTSIAALRIFPVQFNPVTQTLRVYSNIRIKVSFDEGVDNFTDDKVLTPSHERLFMPLLLNGSTALSVGDADSAYEADNSLLIITHPNFLAAAKTLAAWKIKRGIHTTVKTTAEIGSTASVIQQYIKDAYTSATASKPPPSYVLFIGDAEFIPTHYETVHPYHGFLTGTDLYYATVDGTDYYPDIFLGRLSVDTLTQANNRVNDIIGYEKAVVVDNTFYEKATVATYFQDRDRPWLPKDGRDNRRFAMTSEDVVLHLQNEAYSVDRIYYTESDVTPLIWGKYFSGGPAGNIGSAVPAYLKKPGFSWDGDADDIKTAINQGRFLVTHRDHGHKTIGWGDPRYTPADVSALTNGDKLPVVWSVNCETGWFDNETDPASAATSSGTLHFSEAWERNSGGGAVGIIAATRVSYSNANDRLVWGWMDAIWPTFEPSTPNANPIWEMGAVLNYGKLYMANKYSNDVKRKTEFEMFHWFGDPTMEIWTDVPQTLTISHDASVVEGATSIDVNVNTAGALIAISKANAENGEILGKTMSVNGISNVSLSKSLAIGEQVSVVVTKHNYRPYERAVIVTEDTPCAVPTVTSNGAGGWTPQAPVDGDIALILVGHTVTTDFVDTTNLCIEQNGKLISTAGAELFVMASGIVLNKGEIRGADGNDGGCPTGTNNASKYVHATPAKNVVIMADKFVNEGNIYGGRGGDDSTWKCLGDNSPGSWTYTFIPPIPGIPAAQTRTHQSNLGTWVRQYNARQIGYGFPSVGESGGKVEINSYTFTNKGLITGGVGGDGDSRGPGSSYVHGTSVGGRGGFLTINVNDLAGSTNTGTLKGGCGGHVDEPGCWDTGDFYNRPGYAAPFPNNSTSCPGNNINGSRSGNGGDATFNAANQLGVMIGCTGSTTRWDPTTLKADSNTRFEGSDHVEIFGPGDWVMDLEGLVEGAVSANKTITLAVGKGGVIDLRGVSGKVFKAAEKVEIFADHILLDEGVIFADLAEAPVINVEQAKILYRLALNGEQHMVGKAGTTIAVRLSILNNGPTEDTYTLTLGNTAGWSLSNLPNTVKVESLKKESLSFDVTLPQESGENILTIMATSQGDPEISEILGIRVISEGAAQEYNVTGTVKDTTDKPVAEVTITVGDQIVTTDANGSWEIIGIVDGGYTVVASKDGYTIAPKDFVVNGENVTLNLEAKVVIKGEYTASGIIRDKAGNPVVGVTVQVGDKTVITDDAGNWKIANMQEGEYTITASKEAYTFAPVEFALGNDEFTQKVVMKPLSALNVKVVVEPRTPKQGENITFIATVTNGGSEAATGVVLTDVLPSGFSLVSIEALDGGECDANTMTCTLPDLTSGATARVKLVVSNPNANQSVVNTATVTANEYPADVHKRGVYITPHLSTSCNCTPRKVMPEGELHCTVDVVLSSLAPSAATGVELVITLPNGVELQSVNSDYGMCDTSNLPTLTCSLTDLSVDNADALSHAIVSFDEVLKNPGILLLTHDAKVTANEYSAHTDRERTKVIIPPEYQVDIAFVIDVTGSMQQEMNGTKNAVKNFIAKIDQSLFPLTALVVFRDEVTVKAVTTDLSLVETAIDNMEASGGGTCPEASVEALDVAITHVKEGGTIFFVTDASPYEKADVAGISERLTAKEIIFNAIITGDCSNRDSWNLPTAD